MSFILDSLRKSEHARQESVGPGIADVRTSTHSGTTGKMAYWLGGLLIANILVVTIALWRPWVDDPTAIRVRTVQPPPVLTERPTPAAVQPRLSQRSEVRSLAGEVRTTAAQSTAAPPVMDAPAQDTPPQMEAAPARRAAIAPTPGEILPTIHELQITGRLNVSTLHLDMHMFHDDPTRRFVFVNSKKYKEGERISEGPLLEEIRADSVVFYHQGQRFLLPR